MMKLVVLLGLTLALVAQLVAARSTATATATPTPTPTPLSSSTAAEDDDDATNSSSSTTAPCTFPSCLQFSRPVCAKNSRGDVIFFYNYCDLLVRNCRDHDDYEPVEADESCPLAE